MIDPSAAHTVYVGTAGGGVFQSFDGGSSWQPTGLLSGMALSLAMDSSTVLYAGTEFAGAQVSHDLGATWTGLDPSLGSTNGFGYGLWIDPADSRKIFVSTIANGLLLSLDGGSTWAVAGRGYTSVGSRQVVFDPSNSQRIYAGSYLGGGLFKSEDGGLNWSRHRFAPAGVYVLAVQVNALNSNIVYAATNGDGVFKSVDYGETWAAIGSGLPVSARGVIVTSLTVDPSNGQRLFAATSTGFYLSADDGATWAQVLNKAAWTISIDPNVPSTVYATTRTNGIFRSLDGGNTWRDINTGLISLSMGRSAPVLINPADPSRLYVGTQAGVFKSSDGGEHWEAVNSGLDNLSVGGLVMDPGDPSVLYACGPDGVYKTVTGGETKQ